MSPKPDVAAPLRIRPRGVRTKGAWLLVIPFFLFATPFAGALFVGVCLTVLGLGVRAWAAGTIRKDEALTTTGPYAYARHPLYLGSFLIGIGLGIAGGHWIWPVGVATYFALVYSPTIREEAERLTELFGHRYVHYARRVPALVPRLRPYAPGADAPVLAWPSAPAGLPATDTASEGESDADREGAEGAFSWRQYRRNREWEALLGALAAFAVLAIELRIRG
ncbi:MAG: isoprenylcysteine carboxylmethyltransferase family protein [Gemmatimonadota bacterium]